MSGPLEPGAGGLERRYQWLLAWYPPRHRAAHGEEMLGVLLAAAPDGQRRPRIAEAANLLWGALLIWLRPRPRLAAEAAASPWRDALAAFSVAAPLALVVEFAAAMTTEGPGVWARGGPVSVLFDFAFGGLALAVPFVVLGLRRTGGFVCCIAALLLALMAGNNLYTGGFRSSGGAVIAFSLLCYATEAWALLGSPGPRRGWRLVSWPAWALIMVAAALAGVLKGMAARITLASAHFYTIWLHQQPHVAAWLIVAVAAGVALAAIAAGVARRSAVGRRLLTLFAISACPWLVGINWYFREVPVVGALVTYLPPLILTSLVVAAVRRERRSAADAGQAARA